MKLVRKMVAPTIWLIVLSFALWGVGSLATGLRKDTYAAGTVFGKTITWREYQSALQSVEFFLQSPTKPRSSEELEIAAWHNLAFAVQAERENVHVTDDEVRNEIKKYFGGDIPDSKYYEKWTMQVLKDRPHDFEERVRKFLKIRKLMILHEPKLPVPAQPNQSNKESGDKTAEAKQKEDSEKAFTAWMQDVITKAQIKKFKSTETNS